MRLQFLIVKPSVRPIFTSRYLNRPRDFKLVRMHPSSIHLFLKTWNYNFILLLLLIIIIIITVMCFYLKNAYTFKKLWFRNTIYFWDSRLLYFNNTKNKTLWRIEKKCFQAFITASFASWLNYWNISEVNPWSRRGTYGRWNLYTPSEERVDC